jgi:hypothetical protein
MGRFHPLMAPTAAVRIDQLLVGELAPRLVRRRKPEHPWAFFIASVWNKSKTPPLNALPAENGARAGRLADIGPARSDIAMASKRGAIGRTVEGWKPESPSATCKCRSRRRTPLAGEPHGSTILSGS